MLFRRPLRHSDNILPRRPRFHEYEVIPLKVYEIPKTNSPMVTRYAFMSLMADGACAAMLHGSISLHCTTDKLMMLILFYNILAIGTSLLFSVLADRVGNKHTGVRAAVMILFMGFVFPTRISITAKVVLMAIGNAAFHSFAASSLLSRSRFLSYGIGCFTTGGVIGVALARYAPFFGYLAAAFLLMAAAPCDKGEGLPEACDLPIRDRVVLKSRLAPLLILLLLLCCALGSYMGHSLSFEWAVGRKSILLIAAAAAAGRALGGFLFDRFSLYSVAASLGGGAALLMFSSDSKVLSLGGILLLNMMIPVLLSLLFRFMPRHPGMCYSLSALAGYLGLHALRLFPSFASRSTAVISLVCGLLLLSTSAAELLCHLSSFRSSAHTPSPSHSPSSEVLHD